MRHLREAGRQTESHMRRQWGVWMRRVTDLHRRAVRRYWNRRERHEARARARREAQEV